MKLTPLYNIHLGLGAKMVTSGAGYQVAANYGSVEEEHRAVRERVGLMDLSHMTRFDIKGNDSLQLIQTLAVNDASKLTDGQVMYTTFCNEEGNIVDDVTVWRFNRQHFRVVASSKSRFRTIKWIEAHIDEGMLAYVTDISASLGMISVQGPCSRDTLQKISDSTLQELRFFRFTVVKLAGISTVVARLGYTGELGYECYMSTEDTVQAWSEIMNAGRAFDISPYGYDALDTLRLEKGFVYFGGEVSGKNNPFECGLDRWIRFDNRSFVGKQALLNIRENGPERKLIGLELHGDAAAAATQQVMANEKKIGEIALCFRGFTVRKNLAWAYVMPEHAEPGTQVTVDSRGNSVPATVVDIRRYDPTDTRIRA